MTGWKPPVPKPTDRADVAAARRHLARGRAELLIARQLLLGAVGSFDVEKIVQRDLDPLAAQVADLVGWLEPWAE